MLKTFGVSLLLCTCLGPAYGQEQKAAGQSTSEAVQQIERDWTDAEKTVDIGKLNEILADDWMGIGPDGNRMTKTDFVNMVKSGAEKLQSFEFGPMHVKAIGGTVAVVQGSDTEKSSFKGKDTSGKWVWMDVFVKHDGKWQAVRSQTAMVK